MRWISSGGERGFEIGKREGLVDSLGCCMWFRVRSGAWSSRLLDRLRNDLRLDDITLGLRNGKTHQQQSLHS